MKRAGFTMIELIFVIVILGILAAVAVPKLNATRDDAKLTKAASEVSQAIGDIGSYYTARGSMGVPADMTNVSFDDDNMSDGSNYETDGATATNCLKFTTTSDGNLTVEDGDGTSPLCTKLRALIGSNDMNGTHSFGGSSVTF